MIVDAPGTKMMEFVARWYLPVNDARTLFEYKDHDPRRYSCEMIIDLMNLQFVPKTKRFMFGAETVGVLDDAAKHHGEIGTPAEPTAKNPVAKKPAAKKPTSKKPPSTKPASTKPGAREPATKRARDEEDDEEKRDEDDDEERGRIG